jgi:hypothetical protein
MRLILFMCITPPALLHNLFLESQMLYGRISGCGMNFVCSKFLVTLLRARVIAAQCDSGQLVTVFLSRKLNLCNINR